MASSNARHGRNGMRSVGHFFERLAAGRLNFARWWRGFIRQRWECEMKAGLVAFK